MTHGEENVSTEQRSAQEEARVPLPHEHRKGAARAEAPARQRPEEIDRLEGELDESFTRADRLLRRRDFEAVYSRGRRVSSRHFVMFVLPNGADRSRLGVTLSRKVGNAVTRNRARRCLREAFRRDQAIRCLGVDIVVQAVPRIAEATSAMLKEELAMAVDRYARIRKEPGREDPRNRPRSRPERGTGSGPGGGGR